MVKDVAANFTLQELLAFLQQEEDAPEGFYTAREWADYFGTYPEKMRLILAEANNAGILLRTKAKRERLDQVMQLQPVYSFDLTELEGQGGQDSVGNDSG